MHVANFNPVAFREKGVLFDSLTVDERSVRAVGVSNAEYPGDFNQFGMCTTDDRGTQRQLMIRPSTNPKR